MEFWFHLNVVYGIDDCMVSLNKLAQFIRSCSIHRHDVDVDAMLYIIVCTPAINKGGCRVNNLHNSVVIILIVTCSTQLIFRIIRYLIPN